VEACGPCHSGAVTDRGRVPRRPGNQNHHDVEVTVTFTYAQATEACYLLGEAIKHINARGRGANGGLTKTQRDRRRKLRRVVEVLNAARIEALAPQGQAASRARRRTGSGE
jgi:hypothetical protein